MGNMIQEWAKDMLYKQVMNGSELVTYENYLDRMDVCKGCKYNGIVDVPLVGIKDNGCTKCGCPFATKARIKTVVNPITQTILNTETVECTHEDGNKWEDVDKKYQ
jgi:hypothetical protein